MALTASAPFADLGNWRTRPHSVWAFQHVRDLIACADISNDPSRVTAFPMSVRSLDAFQIRAPGGATLSLTDFQDATDTDGLVVMHDGQIVHEYYANGMGAHSPHIIMSASKSIVGLIAGMLVARGLLDVDALVSDVVPEIAHTAYQDATIRQLLDMRTGVVMDAAQLLAYRAACNWDPLAPNQQASDLHRYFTTSSATRLPHGGPFKYLSANTDLLGWVLERAGQQPFASLVSELLWQPMGAEDDAFITVDRCGAPRTTGGLCMTTRDLARVGQLIVQDGRPTDVPNSSQIISSDWIADIAENGDREAWKKGEFAAGFGGLAMHYRSGWYVINDKPQILFAMGIHGQNLFVDRANRLVIAKLSSQDQPTAPLAVGLTLRAVAAFRKCLVE